MKTHKETIRLLVAVDIKYDTEEAKQIAISRSKELVLSNSTFGAAVRAGGYSAKPKSARLYKEKR